MSLVGRRLLFDWREKKMKKKEDPFGCFSGFLDCCNLLVGF